MTANYVRETSYDQEEKEEYYASKRLSGFSAVCVGASFIINAAIVAYAIISQF